MLKSYIHCLRQVYTLREHAYIVRNIFLRLALASDSSSTLRYGEVLVSVSPSGSISVQQYDGGYQQVWKCLCACVVAGSAEMDDVGYFTDEEGEDYSAVYPEGDNCGGL